MKCNQFFTVVKKAHGEKHGSAASEAGAYYYSIKSLQHICQSKLFKKISKNEVLLKKMTLLMLITLIHIKFLKLITLLLTIETKGKKRYEVAGITFPTEEQYSMKPLGLHRPMQ